MRLRTG